MRGDDLRNRTKSFALDTIELVESLPKGKMPDVIGKQLLRSGTSVGANSRAACRAKSKADFISKMGIVEEEADESIYWMELIVETGLLPHDRVREIRAEAAELLAIVVSSIKTTKKTVYT